MADMAKIWNNVPTINLYLIFFGQISYKTGHCDTSWPSRLHVLGKKKNRKIREREMIDTKKTRPQITVMLEVDTPID